MQVYTNKFIMGVTREMASRTVLKKVEVQEFIPVGALDRAFNKNGLCAYCEAKYRCSLCEDSGTIFDCADYRPSSDEVTTVSFSTLAETQYEEEEELHGLCAECQRRDICPLKYIRGGVWHCEEFQ